MKEIQLRRKEQISYLPARVIAESRKKLGSIFVSRSPLRGLTRDEERKYLPLVIGIDATSPNFEKAARKFWADFTIDVPSDGLVLNITLDENGEPLQLDDWIKYQWAIKHRFVGENKEAMQKDPRKTFYVYNPEKEVHKQHAAVQDKKAAYKEFIRVTADKGAAARILRVMGTLNPESMTDEQQENLLHNLMENDPRRFLAVATDKNIEVRELIFRLRDNEILREVGASFLYLDQTIGDTVDETVSWFNNKRNSATIAEMRAKLKEFEA